MTLANGHVRHTHSLGYPGVESELVDEGIEADRGIQNSRHTLYRERKRGEENYSSILYNIGTAMVVQHYRQTAC